MNTIRIHLFASLCIVCAIWLSVTGCSEREPNNPFDPKGSGKPPLLLSVSSQDNDYIRLNWRWREDPITDYSGFRIYRAVGGNEFQLYREIGRNQFSFIDSTAQRYNWYFYKVSVFSPSAESILSSPQRAYLGQGVYWILSSGGFWIRKVSYDLLRTLNHYDIFYPPEEWAISLTDSVIWTGFFRYGLGVSRLNLQKGDEDFFYFENLNRPVDVAYDEQTKKVYILDLGIQGEPDRIHILQDQGLQSRFPLPEGNYLKIFLSNSSQSLIILGEKKIFRMSLSSMTLTDTLVFSRGFLARDMHVSSNWVFVLTSSAQDTTSKIYRTSVGLGSPDSLVVGGDFYRITYDPISDGFYLAENVPAARDQVAKLSPQGTRLLRLIDFRFVEQIGLNPYDQSVVVVDRFGDQLILFDKDGNEISRSQQNAFYDPIRIFIE